MGTVIRAERWIRSDYEDAMLDIASMSSNAAECVRMAGEADSARQRAMLLGLAQAWVALSDQAREVEHQVHKARDPEPAW